jgi:hypothetical protein
MRSSTLAKKSYPYNFRQPDVGEQYHRNWMVNTMGQAYKDTVLSALGNEFFDCRAAYVHKQVAMYCAWHLVDRSPYRCLWELRHWLNTALAAAGMGVAFDGGVMNGGVGSFYTVEPDELIRRVMFQIDAHRGINAQHGGARHCSAWENRVTVSNQLVSTFADRLSLLCHWRMNRLSDVPTAHRRTTKTTAAWMEDVIECIPLYLTGLRNLQFQSGGDWATYTRDEIVRYNAYRSHKMMQHLAGVSGYGDYRDELDTNTVADLLDEDAAERYCALGKLRDADDDYGLSYHLHDVWDKLPV